MAAENSDDAAPKTIGVPFEKGRSGNPGGRPKKLAELAIKISEMDEKYRLRLDTIAEGGGGIEEKDSIAAIKLLWAYAHGNPSQAITDAGGGPLKLGVIVLPPEEAE